MRIFLSYHTPDARLAESLKAALERQISGSEVFFAPHSLSHGAFWQPALAEAIDRAQAFVILLGERVGRWQLMEYYAALDRRTNDPNFLLLPLLIAGTAPGLPFLSQIHWLQAPDPTREPILSQIIGALVRNAQAAPAPLWGHVNPYRGLESLREEDADYFFGRDAETTRAIETLAGTGNRIVTFVGNSGVGKSSLVEAGLFASLKRQRMPGHSSWPADLRDSREWAYVTIRPGEEPVQALVGGIVDLWYGDATDPLRIARRSEWTDLLTRGQASIGDLLKATRQRFENELSMPPPRRILININQCEELFGLATQDKIDLFSELLTAALAGGTVCAVASLRSDYYGELQQNAKLFDSTSLIDVRPFDNAGLETVITGPARRLGVSFESDKLPQSIVKSAAGDKGVLPLLADYMTDVWTRMQARGDGVMRYADQADHSDPGTALSDRADRFLRTFPKDQDMVRQLFSSRLVVVTGEGQAIRRPVPVDRMTAEELRVANALAAQEWRLLTIEKSDAGVAKVDIAHEVLISRWETFRNWISANRDFLSFSAELDRLQDQWTQSGLWRKNEHLPRRSDLSRARRFARLGYKFTVEQAGALAYAKARMISPLVVAMFMATVSAVLILFVFRPIIAKAVVDDVLGESYDPRIDALFADTETHAVIALVFAVLGLPLIPALLRLYRLFKTRLFGARYASLEFLKGYGLYILVYFISVIPLNVAGGALIPQFGEQIGSYFAASVLSDAGFNGDLIGAKKDFDDKYSTSPPDVVIQSSRVLIPILREDELQGSRMLLPRVLTATSLVAIAAGDISYALSTASESMDRGPSLANQTRLAHALTHHGRDAEARQIYAGLVGKREGSLDLNNWIEGDFAYFDRFGKLTPLMREVWSTIRP